MGLGANTGTELTLLCWYYLLHESLGYLFPERKSWLAGASFFVVVVVFFLKPHHTAYEILVPHQELALSSEHAES